MPKGMFSQGAMVLTGGPLADDAIAAALAPFEVAKHKPAEAHPGWMGGHATWVVVMRREVNGLVLVEMVDAPWPDHMGDPKAPGGMTDPMGDAMLFGAWSMGFLGPHTFPGNLARARQVAEMTGQDFLSEAAGSHRAFVRIRSSYVMGAEDDAKILPEDYDARAELEFVTRVARVIAGVDGALCYFNPGGETLFTPSGMDEMTASCAAEGVPALPVWSCGRLVRLESVPGDWMLADVLGMEQLMAQDHEAVFQPGRFDPNEVIRFLRNIANYTLDNGPVIKTGETTDGPGGLWRVAEMEESLMPAPRATMRWYADDGPRPPAKLLGGASPASASPTKPRGGIAGRLKSLFGR